MDSCELNTSMASVIVTDSAKLFAKMNSYHMSHALRKQDYCLCENKDIDQQCVNCFATLILSGYPDSRTL